MPPSSNAHLSPPDSGSPSTVDAPTPHTPPSASDDDDDMVMDRVEYSGNSFQLKDGRSKKSAEGYDLGGTYDAHEGGEAQSFLSDTRRDSLSSVQSYEIYTPDEDKAVLRKLDRRLVGFMALLYCLSFLDRSSMAHSSFVV